MININQIEGETLFFLPKFQLQRQGSGFKLQENIFDFFHVRSGVD